MQDETMATIEEWLYPDPNVRQGERVAEVSDRFANGTMLTDGHKVCIAYAILKSGVLLVPGKFDDVSEHDTVVFRPRFDFELPTNAGIHIRKGMTVTLIPETEGEVGVQIPVPVYISGDYEGELTVAQDPTEPAIDKDTLTHLMYAVFAPDYEYRHTDWGELNDARWELFYRMQRFAGAVVESEDAAFIKHLQEHVDSFQTNLQWPKEPVAVESRDGRLRVSVAAGQ